MKSQPLAAAALLLPLAMTTEAHDGHNVTAPSKRAALIESGAGKVLRVYGEVMKIGGGEIQSWVSLGKDMSEVGVTLSPETLDQSVLPTLEQGAAHWAHLRFPKVPGNPYNHAMMVWRPAGLTPDGPLNMPAYDFHFALVEPEVMSSIQPDDPKAQVPPPAGYMPADYVPQTTADGQLLNVSGHGVHWLDQTAPEWNGGVFSETVLWGSYDGMTTFVVPMVTLDTLLTTPEHKEPLKLPACVRQTGFYPQSYGWRQHTDTEGNTQVELYLTDFRLKLGMPPALCARYVLKDKNGELTP